MAVGDDLLRKNPFRDWTFLVLPYASGDFHSGTGEYHYMDGSKERVVYHNGYNNYSAFMNAAMPYVGNPDTLLVTGFSAGGFATSLLADDVIDRFPSAENITVCVDSSLLLYDGWHETADGLQEKISGVGIFIWKYGEDPETHNTQHTIISSNAFDKLEDDVSVADWIYAAVNGNVQSHGLELLK